MDYSEGIEKYSPLWGEWEIEEQIGIGSYGKVYKISKWLGNEKVISAVKHIKIPTMSQYEDAMLSLGNSKDTITIYFKDILNKFENEVKLLYKLRGNTNIVSYEDYMIREREDMGWDILIKMEYVTPLNKFIEARNLTKEMIINLGIDICNGLKLCHDNGIIHRDIKDSNIFISENNNFKIGDFGVATNLSSENANTRIGTPYYMAPEVILNYKGYDKTVDIYSLGIVLYRMFNKLRFPFVPLNNSEITYNSKEIAQARRVDGEALPKACDAEEELWKIIKKACDHNPSDRYSSVDDLKFDLMNLLRNMREEEKKKVIIKATGLSNNNPYFTEKDINNSGEILEQDIEDTQLIEEETVLLEDENIYTEEETILIESDNRLTLEDENTLLIEDTNKGSCYDNKKTNRKHIAVLAIMVTFLIALFGFKIITNNKNNLLSNNKNNLPIVSDELGSSPSNLASYTGGSEIPSYIIKSKDETVYYEASWDIYRSYIDVEFDEPITVGEIQPSSFNKYGNYIYYVRGDNDMVEKYDTVSDNEDSDVYGIEAKQIIIMEDYIYYNDINDGQHLYKMNLIDGTKEKIIDRPVNIFSINSKYVVYRKNANETIYMMNLETKETSILDIDSIDGYGWIALFENCIIYLNNSQLCKINFKDDGIDSESIEIIQEDVYGFALEDKYLYFIDKNQKLYVRDLYNEDVYFIAEGVTCINASENMMYYVSDYVYVEEFSPYKYEKVN